MNSTSFKLATFILLLVIISSCKESLNKRSLSTSFLKNSDTTVFFDFYENTSDSYFEISSRLKIEKDTLLNVYRYYNEEMKGVKSFNRIFVLQLDSPIFFEIRGVDSIFYKCIKNEIIYFNSFSDKVYLFSSVGDHIDDGSVIFFSEKYGVLLIDPKYWRNFYCIRSYGKSPSASNEIGRILQILYINWKWSSVVSG